MYVKFQFLLKKEFTNVSNILDFLGRKSVIVEGFWAFWVETATPDRSEIVFSSYLMYLSPRDHPLHVQQKKNQHFGQTSNSFKLFVLTKNGYPISSNTI